MRRRRLAFPTGKVARPLAVTDESQNAAYFLQPNWNGSIVHPPAHKQSRFQLARLAARATLPAREGKCALRAQDAHLYKSQFGGVVAAYRLPLPLGEVPAGRRGPSQSLRDSSPRGGAKSSPNSSFLSSISIPQGQRVCKAFRLLVDITHYLW